MNITFTVIKCAPRRRLRLGRLVVFLLGLSLGLAGLISLCHLSIL